MKTARTFLIAIFLITSFISAAQATKDQTTSFVIEPAGPDVQTPDSILVVYWIENVAGSYGYSVSRAQSSDGVFKFKFPTINHLTRFEILFYTGGKAIKSLKHCVEPFDQINIRFRNNNSRYMFLEFSGKGAEKYQLREALDKEMFQANRKVSALINKPNVYNRLISGELNSSQIHEYIDSLNIIVRKSEANSLKKLSEFKSVIPTDILKFYSYEFISGGVRGILYSSFADIKKMETKKIYADYFLKNVRDSFESDFDNPLVAYSSAYILNRGIALTIESAMRNVGKPISFETRYDEIKSIPNRDLRDLLLTRFFLSAGIMQGPITNFSKKDSCLKDAISVIKKEHLNSALRYELVYTKGSKVYDFAFEDTTGKVFKLKDFRNKILMIEFYGYGCTGCAQFHSQFHNDIYPEFSNNTDFEVVSVSVDGSKRMWDKSMQSGKFTDKSYVNLYAGQKNVKNDMFKYYRVNAIPFILLVDGRGNLISRLNNGMSSESIRLTIRSELKKLKQGKDSK